MSEVKARRSLYSANALHVALALSVTSACGSGGGQADDHTGTVEQALAEAELGPEELIIDSRRYVRQSSLSKEELEALKDPKLWELPETEDKLAQLLRAHISHSKYGDYIEAEPNYRLARISLGIEESPTPLQGAAEPPEVRPTSTADDVDNVEVGVISKSISSNGDGRLLALVTDIPYSAVAMSESGGGGAMLDWRIYTAAHVVYNNALAAGADGWICRNGSTDAGNPSCVTPGHPRWRFGGRVVSGSPTWITGWILCGYKNVTNGWINLPANASGTTRARWDYAFQNLDGCLPNNTGSNGWWILNQATLRQRTITQAGYPVLFTCPALSLGSTNNAAGNCPQSGSQGVVQTLPGIGTRPYTGGTEYLTTAFDANVVVTGGYIQSSLLDVTSGQSGGPVLAPDQNGIYIVGAAANTSQGSAVTNFNHLTNEVFNFLHQ
jgi:hypothetical protein